MFQITVRVALLKTDSIPLVAESEVPRQMTVLIESGELSRQLPPSMEVPDLAPGLSLQ